MRHQVILLLNAFTIATTIDTTGFETRIKSLVDDTLGRAHMQDVIDNQVPFISTSIDGPTVIQQLSEVLKMKINDQFHLAKMLRDTVAAEYSQFKLVATDAECCHVHMSDNLIYDYRFKSEVKLDAMCLRVSSYADSEAKYASRALLQQFMYNMQVVPGVKYQYLGTQQGLMFTYPAAPADSCSDYDPRLRPWYVEAATPVGKDIVVVIDVSGTMGIYEGYPQTKKRLSVSKLAAQAIIDSLNPRDRIAIVSFNAYGYVYTDPHSDCYNAQLAVASPRNKMLMHEYIDGLHSHGESYFSRGLETAFNLFIGSDYTEEFAGERKKAILFLSDGSANENVTIITDLIQRKEQELNNEVTIMTYAIGSITMGAQQTLQTITETLEQMGIESIAPVFIENVDETELKNAMVTYYQFFSNNVLETPILVTPYFDAFGLGVITTISMPVHHNGQFIGVVGIDISLSDLFEDISYFEQDAKTYAFVIDSQGFALSHPMLPVPVNIKDDPVHVSIVLLERYTSETDIFTSMKSVSSGQSLATSTTIFQGKGDGKTDGITLISYTADYYWAQIKYNVTDSVVLSVGLKVANDWTQNHPSLTGATADTEFVYHKHTLMEEPSDTCVHFWVSALKDKSTVKFSPEAFVSPFLYVDTKETQQTVSTYQQILAGQAENDIFRAGVIDTVKMSASLDSIWHQNESFAAYLYVAFANGVMRISPGHQLPKFYNPTHRKWYKQAASFSGTYTVTPPYLDATGAGFVVSISHTLFKGVPGAESHNDTEPVIGVMGVDVTLSYFYSIFLQSFPECRLGEYRCFLMDPAGFIVIHHDYVEISAYENPLKYSLHVTVKEQNVANYLINNGYMVRKSCHNAQNPIEHYNFYEVNLDSLTEIDNPSGSPEFQLKRVSDTNLFFVKHRTDAYLSPVCSCTDTVSLSPLCPDTMDDSECVCPCKANMALSYQPCTNRFIYENLTNVWICPSDGVEMEAQFNEALVNSGDMCNPTECSVSENWHSCALQTKCNWCMRDESGELFVEETPFCGMRSECYFGQIGFISPYKELHGHVHDHVDAVIFLILISTLSTFTTVVGTLCLCYFTAWILHKIFPPTISSEVRNLSAIDTMSKEYVNETFAEELKARREKSQASSRSQSVKSSIPSSNSQQSDSSNVNSNNNKLALVGYGAIHHKPVSPTC